MSSESPQRPNRPPEMPAVKTTIVGGRPPGSGAAIGSVPRGLEILIKKAAVDPEFRALLLEKRSGAAAELELVLEPAEMAMLDSVPAEQLEAIIANTKVPEATRRALLGKITVGTLAALGAVAAVESCTLGIRPEVQTLGVQPDRPTQGIRPGPIPSTDTQPAEGVTRGVRPDRPSSRPAE